MSAEDKARTSQSSNKRVETVYDLWMAWGGNVYHASEDCPNAQRANGGREVTNKNGDFRPCSTCMVAKDHPYVEEYYA